MKFTKYMRSKKPYWFSGIYKIVSYNYHRGERCKRYYHVYIIESKNWGDYVGGKAAQLGKRLTFAQCVKLAKDHAASGYEPTRKQLKQAEIAKQSWVTV